MLRQLVRSLGAAGTVVLLGYLFAAQAAEPARLQPTISSKPALRHPAGLPEPKLTVAGASVHVQSNCSPPKPALIAKVTIKNSGGPLAAGKGTVYIKEIGGSTNLSSAGIHLPAFHTGASQIVNIPVITLLPYAKLPGTHALGVYLNPDLKDGQRSFIKPAGVYRVTTRFPAGHCQARHAAPRVTTKRILTPEDTRGLRPQPEPPGRTTTPVSR